MNMCYGNRLNIPKCGYFTYIIKRFLQNLFLGRGRIAILPTGFGNSLIFQLFPRLINTLQRKAVSTISVITPLVATMKYQVEQLQSIGIRAVAIGVARRIQRRSSKNGSARLFMKVLKACCRRNGGKNYNKQIVRRSHRNRWRR